ncbi:hypothetical protein BV25DRAFT_1768404, partial [Artomyces pyxidatus]
YLSNEHPSYETHLSRLRQSSFVPVVLGPTLPRSDRSVEEYDKFCRAMLIIFKPWRTLVDLKGAGETWSEAYGRHSFPAASMKIINNINVEHQCKDARDRMSSERR